MQSLNYFSGVKALSKASYCILPVHEVFMGSVAQYGVGPRHIKQNFNVLMYFNLEQSESIYVDVVFKKLDGQSDLEGAVEEVRRVLIGELNARKSENFYVPNTFSFSAT